MIDRERLRRSLRAVLRWLRPGLAVAIPLLALLHFLVRDRWWPVSALYYAAPLPLIAAAATVYVAIAWRRKVHLAVAGLYAALLWGWWGTRPAPPRSCLSTASRI